MAIIFELPNYGRYRPVTLRILEGLRTDWANAAPRIVQELDIAIAALRKHRL